MTDDYDLRSGGESVAWWPGSDDSLLFYAGAPSREWSSYDSFLLRMGHGTTAAFLPAPSVESPPTVLRSSDHFEQDVFMATAAARSLDEEFWFWRVLSAGNATYGSTSLAFDLPPTVETGTAVLDLSVSGATTFGAQFDHHLVVSVNGSEVGEATWSGVGAKSFRVTFDGDLLSPFENLVEIEALVPPGVSASVVYVDSFDVTYWCASVAENDRLAVELGDEVAVSASGFSSSEIHVLDVTDPLQPRRIGVASELGDGWRTSFDTSGLGTSLYLHGPEAVESPRVESAPAIADGEAEYLVLAPNALLDAAQTLADLRSAAGLVSRVIDVQRVWDDFGHGVPDPEAIHAFLTQAWNQWDMRPRFVVLAGAGSLDYRDALGQGTNLIPPQVTLTTRGLFASDVMLGDVEGDDGVPEIAVGRLPVLSSQELLDVIDKISGWEATSPSDLRVGLLADNRDGAGNFSQSSDRVKPLVASAAVDRVYLDELPLSLARQALLDSFNRGSSFINYFGHGGLDRLASEGLLTVSDVAQLPKMERPPLFAGLTCTIGRFEVPGFTSLAEALVLAPQRGAISVWSPSGLSINDAALALDQAFVAALFEHETLGEAILAAMRDYSNSDWSMSMLEVYNLIGDPALGLGSFNPGGVAALFSDDFESGNVNSWSSAVP